MNGLLRATRKINLVDVDGFPARYQEGVHDGVQNERADVMSVKQGGTADYIIKIYNLCPWMKYPGIEVFYLLISGCWLKCERRQICIIHLMKK